jgi:hypothetical protein
VKLARAWQLGEGQVRANCDLETFFPNFEMVSFTRHRVRHATTLRARERLEESGSRAPVWLTANLPTEQISK